MKIGFSILDYKMTTSLGKLLSCNFRLHDFANRTKSHTGFETGFKHFFALIETVVTETGQNYFQVFIIVIEKDL